MPTVEAVTRIRAPLDRCFDLARSIDLHVASQTKHDEVPIAGVKSGLIQLGNEVTWRARHLGVQQTLTSRITILERPTRFRDVMLRGAFKTYQHDHFFARDGSHTVMRDVCEFEAPLGLLGMLANVVFLKRYVAALVRNRASTIRRVAESDEWRCYLGPAEHNAAWTADPTYDSKSLAASDGVTRPQASQAGGGNYPPTDAPVGVHIQRGYRSRTTR